MCRWMGSHFHNWTDYGDHSLVYLTLNLEAQRTRTSYTTTRSYKNFDPDKFIEDLSHVPFHIVSFFEDLNDQFDTFNSLFLDVLNEHAPIKRVKINSKPNPFITPEISQLMKTRDNCINVQGRQRIVYYGMRTSSLDSKSSGKSDSR